MLYQHYKDYIKEILKMTHIVKCYVFEHDNKELFIIGNHVAELERCPYCNKIININIGTWSLTFVNIKKIIAHDEHMKQRGTRNQYECMWCSNILKNRNVIGNYEYIYQIKYEEKEKLEIENITLTITRCNNCNDIINIYNEFNSQEIWTVDTRNQLSDVKKVWCKGCGIVFEIEEYVSLVLSLN